ncbi:MAG: hypothetical protein GX799_00810 [Crenarchaeota archaeon]|jgi:hypothetical protein|nr:hypothetical protein [Thermoproteota archaeon]
MLSRSAVVKLKAILIIDFIIIASAAGAYFYLQDQGIITGASKPATFVLSDLVISSNEAFVGEAIQISVNVTNIGDEEGTVLLELLINDVAKDSFNLTLAGLKSSEIVDFTVIETNSGNYSVQIGDQYGSFILKEAPPESSKIILSNYKATPYEAWANETVTVTAIAHNPSSETDRLFVRVMVDEVLVNTTTIELEAGASQTVSFAVNATTEGKHVVKINSLQGSFTIVETGYHTLIINRSGGGSKSLPFTLNGEELGTPYQAILPIGEYSISVPTPFDVGTGVLEFTSWSDGSRSSSRSFTLQDRLILVATYTLISGYASCPSLYVWNGTGYSYVTDVSNSGWLGYIGHIKPNGMIVFSDGNPYDYVKIDRNLIAAKDGYYDIVLTQQWNELFYLDETSLLIVDHPIGTDAYMSMTSYLSDGSTGRVYTVTEETITSPISATNEKAENVLEQIKAIDGVFTPGINGYDSVWNNITLNQLALNLGNLSDASEVKLMIRGIVDWGIADPYYEWIESFQDAAAQGLISQNAEIMPAPFLEVKAANGTWIRVNQDIPLPSDFRARTYTVNITGIFPQDVPSYEIRFNNFWNVTYDYIGIDTSTQAEIITQKVLPTSAELSQLWETDSTSTGYFTRYGDVLELMLKADDMYVIGRQGDQVRLQFPEELDPVSDGMVRDYFFVVACWFKDPPGNWGYGFTFNTDPLPFLNMSGFPYPSSESYPYDEDHLAYLAKYNTRVIS